MIPTLHRNGTSKEALTEALENAGHALRNAMNAIGETAPNGRDFYPQGDAVYCAERTARDRCYNPAHGRQWCEGRHGRVQAPALARGN
jgi:hypothetical protein